MRIGLVVNPVSGIGGKAGLKGSDGLDIQQLAHERGFQSEALERTVAALSELPKETLVFTSGGDMGQTYTRLAGLRSVLVHTPKWPSSSKDTVLATKALVKSGIELILFTGGDGTARDVYKGLAGSDAVAVLGIPSGVKMYSGCFGVNPVASGRIAANWLAGGLVNFEDREVLDIGEENIRNGLLDTALHGFVRVPVVRGRTQSRKTASSSSDEQNLESVAEGFVNSMRKDELYILGPGGTTKAIAKRLGVSKTPLGVDVIQNGNLIALDCSEAELLKVTLKTKAHALVSIIGGQGFILGRGNQQISAQVIRSLSAPRIIVVATPNKIASLSGGLLIDSGDPHLDQELEGFYKVITGAKDFVVLRAGPGQ